jgi:hypothetical protein
MLGVTTWWQDGETGTTWERADEVDRVDGGGGRLGEPSRPATEAGRGGIPKRQAPKAFGAGIAPYNLAGGSGHDGGRKGGFNGIPLWTAPKRIRGRRTLHRQGMGRIDGGRRERRQPERLPYNSERRSGHAGACPSKRPALVERRYRGKRVDGVDARGSGGSVIGNR